jgi:tetratricopeptide (TPR) repeat protein
VCVSRRCSGIDGAFGRSAGPWTCWTGGGVYSCESAQLRARGLDCAQAVRHDRLLRAAAIDCLERLIAGSDARHFGARGLRGCIGLSKLAVYLKEAGRLHDAMAQFRLALQEQPGYQPALFGLGDLCVAEGDWGGVEEIIATLPILRVAVEAEVFLGRIHQARAEYSAAWAVLEAAIQVHPLAFTLSHVLMQEGRDLAATEQALRAVLAIDPGHTGAAEPGRAAAAAGADRGVVGDQEPCKHNKHWHGRPYAFWAGS